MFRAAALPRPTCRRQEVETTTTSTSIFEGQKHYDGSIHIAEGQHYGQHAYNKGGGGSKRNHPLDLRRLVQKFDDLSKQALDVSQIDGIDDANLDRMVDSVLMSSRLNEKSLGVDNMNDINFSSSASKLLLEQKQDLRDLSVKFDDPSQAASSLYEETVTNMINGFKPNSKSKDRKPQSANLHYVSMLESENLELSEKALHLERELADSDNRYTKVSLENKRLIEELRNEISRSDTRAKEISSSLVDVRRETEERSLNEKLRCATSWS